MGSNELEFDLLLEHFENKTKSEVAIVAFNYQSTVEVFSAYNNLECTKNW